MLDIALKEWAVVCDLLLEGRTALLLRKGGLHESAGPGVFELQHKRFLLFPSWLHQKPELLKPQWRDRVRSFGAEPPEIALRGLGDAVRTWRLESKADLAKLDDLLCWSPEHIDARFSYKPENALYLVAVRAYRVIAPRTVRNTPEYGGCRSWVALKPADAVEEMLARAAMDNDSFAGLLKRVDGALC